MAKSEKIERKLTIKLGRSSLVGGKLLVTVTLPELSRKIGSDQSIAAVVALVNSCLLVGQANICGSSVSVKTWFTLQKKSI